VGVPPPTGMDSEVQAAKATIIGSGLFTSTLLTLRVLPGL
jgi:Cu/Ag efflux pump CusA